MIVYLLVRRVLSLAVLLSRRDLDKDAELLALRHENAVLRRQAGRVRYEPPDRIWFAALTQLIPRRRWAEVFPVTPATLLAWHRKLAARKRHQRRAQARPPAGDPQHRPPRRPHDQREPAVGIPPDSRRADQAWRHDRTVHRLSNPASRGYRSRTAPSWPDLAAVPARPGSRNPRRRLPARRYRAAEETARPGFHRARHPPDARRRRHRQPRRRMHRTASRNLAISLGGRIQDLKFVIRDRGSNFTQSFDAVFRANGTRILRTAVQAPLMNATCERLVGTLRRELLDRTLILGEQHLRAVLTEYQVHYNAAWPHQGIAQRVPTPDAPLPVRHDRPRY